MQIPSMVPLPNETEQEIGSSEAGRSELATLFDSRPVVAPVRPAQPLARPRLPQVSGRAPRRWIRSLAVMAGKAGVLAALAWGLVFNVSEVRGSSMMPGILDRDRILVDHLTYMLASVGRGDVVVLRYPLDPSLDYLKRVVGLPGDEVVIQDGRVSINGAGWPEPYVAPEAVDPYTSMRTVVREGHYFVLGDNRLHSSDSREFGQVPFEYLRGKVRARIWPLSRLGSID